MFTKPEDVADSRVVDALLEGWDLRVGEIGYAPVGFGSYHWRVTANGDRWFVTVDDLEAKRRRQAETRAEPLQRLSAALSAARSLRDDGMGFVVAPLRTNSGRIVHVVGERFAVALYPQIDGDAHPWGPYPTRADRLAVLELIGALHRAPSALGEAALTDDLLIPHRDQLTAALADRARPWGSGPFAEPARTLLDHCAEPVQRVIERYDRLVAAVPRKRDTLVLTHGEPHRANTISTEHGVVLIDWDTALLAPPERDLWALAQEDPLILEDYTARTGITPNPEALELYSLCWDLTEISIYVGDFCRPHRETDDTRVAWEGLKVHLDPARWGEAV